MLPMLPFLAGIAVGALAVSTTRSGRIGASLHQASDHMRDAARTGGSQLQAMAKASKAFTQRVWDAAATPQAPTATPPSTDAVPDAAPTPAAAPKRRRAAAPRTATAPRATAKRTPARSAAKKTAP